MIDVILQNFILLQTVKSNYQIEIMHRVVTILYFSAFIFKLLINQYERTDHQRKSLVCYGQNIIPICNFAFISFIVNIFLNKFLSPGYFLALPRLHAITRGNHSGSGSAILFFRVQFWFGFGKFYF